MNIYIHRILIKRTGIGVYEVANYESVIKFSIINVVNLI